MMVGRLVVGWSGVDVDVDVGIECRMFLKK